MAVLNFKLGQQAADAFSNFRAEHFGDSLMRQFTEPEYFPELLARQPCFLIGGRGTGKTTVLKSLSFRGKFQREGEKKKDLHEWGYIGLYLKVNTSRVTAFRGPEVSEDQWNRIFSHYLNLVFTGAALEFLEWYEVTHQTKLQINTSSLSEVGAYFGNDSCDSIRRLSKVIKSELISFETAINSIGQQQDLRLTPLGAPMEALLDAMLEQGILGETLFFFLLDEFENLAPYQQRVVNTLIKHARPPYTFKVGVKELGIRERCTLNLSEQLVDPADFRRIDIAERLSRGNDATFQKFASSVCAKRLAPGGLTDEQATAVLEAILPTLAPETEAELLGINNALKEIEGSRLPLLSPAALAVYSGLGALEKYVLWTTESKDLVQVEKYLGRDDFPSNWHWRYDNYKVPALFTLRAGKSGVRKYYCGWKVFCKLSGCNIRYLLELVHRSLQLHASTKESSPHEIAPVLQTSAAQEIGKKNLRELEGLSVHGARLAKFVLSLGRVYEVMAESMAGHTPEMTQFEISPSDDESRDDQLALSVAEFMNQAVMHMAVVRLPGTKLQQSEDIRDYDYALHPIFSAFFGFSYRKKRKLPLSPHEIIGLADHPRNFIAAILNRQHRSENVELPEQLGLFQDFYRGTN